jgi:hypothetical protein
MEKLLQVVGLCFLFSASASASQPALTIYNQDFAVVRDTVPLNLKAGVNQVSFTGATAYLSVTMPCLTLPRLASPCLALPCPASPRLATPCRAMP